METRVYYGEYTLRHWLDLMISRNIILPDYQRSFVWGESDIKRLIESLKSGQFIMPVTIAHYKDESGEKNLILDGQQRLTSLLLVYLGYMPIKEKFKASEDDIAIGDDSQEEFLSNSMEWTYKYLLGKNTQLNNLIKIKEQLGMNDHYKKIVVDFDVDIEDFYDNTYLGFSFIIPNSIEANETQKYFSTLFRNMNYFGKKLSSLESRRSLYYMNADFRNFFDGKLETGEDILCGIRILENMAPKKIDFVRYLAMLSQYIIKKEVKKVMVGYSAYSSRETYYADYVSYIVGLDQEDRKDKFDGFDISSLFPNHEWRKRFEFVKSFIERNKKELGLDVKTGAFTSWIDADYWLYGLLYYVVFIGKKITKEKELIVCIHKEIIIKRSLPKTDDYSKNPNRISNLRDRLQHSLKLYEHYAE